MGDIGIITFSWFCKFLFYFFVNSLFALLVIRIICFWLSHWYANQSARFPSFPTVYDMPRSPLLKAFKVKHESFPRSALCLVPVFLAGNLHASDAWNFIAKSHYWLTDWLKLSKYYIDVEICRLPENFLWLAGQNVQRTLDSSPDISGSRQTFLI